MSAIRVTHLDHCTILITDVAAARHFYGELLGLEEIAPPAEFDFVALWFRVGGGYLHLLKKSEPDTPSARHVCFAVADLAAARARFAAAGVRIDETVKIAAADRFFVRDPDGNRVEILQWLRAYEAEREGQVSA